MIDLNNCNNKIQLKLLHIGSFFLHKYLLRHLRISGLSIRINGRMIRSFGFAAVRVQMMKFQFYPRLDKTKTLLRKRGKLHKSRGIKLLKYYLVSKSVSQAHETQISLRRFIKLTI